MVNIGDIYRFIQFVTDKQRAGSPNAQEISRALDAGQQGFYKYCKGVKEPQEYTPPRDESPYIEARTALIPFSKTSTITSSTSGVAAYPGDFGYIDSIFEGTNSITSIKDSEIRDALRSVIYPISRYPRYKEQDNGIQIYPLETHIIELHYLSRPTTPFIGGNVVGNTFVFDPATSTELQFANNYWMDIIHLSLPYVGVNLDAPAVMSLSNLFNQGAEK